MKNKNLTVKDYCLFITQCLQEFHKNKEIDMELITVYSDYIRNIIHLITKSNISLKCQNSRLTSKTVELIHELQNYLLAKKFLPKAILECI